MKKIMLLGLAVVCMSSVFAQMKPPTYQGVAEDEPTGGFKKENIFAGGSIALGYSGYAFSVGGNPEIGYSLTNWLDAGVVVNLNYYSERADPYYNQNIRLRQFNYGAGVFARVYPINFLFVQIQPEQNWIHYNQKNFNYGNSISGTVNSFSLIGAIGYGQHLVGQANSFIMVGVDLANNAHSPYRDFNGAVVPIVRAGFDFYFNKPSRKK